MSISAPDTAPTRAARWADLAALAALAALFAWLLSVTWHRWGDIVVDCGRDAYLAMRLADGDLLYRDVTSQYPPLAPYLNAFLFRLFGTHLDVLYASGMVSTALVTVLFYRLGRRVVPPAEAAAIAGLLLLTCGFGPYLYNYILPATYSGIYGIIFGLLTLDNLMNAGDRGTPRHLVAAGVCCGLALLCKLETGVAAAAAGAAFCIGRMASAGPRGRQAITADGLRFAIPAAAVTALCAVWLASRGVLASAWFDNIFPAARMQYWNQQFFHTHFLTAAEVGRLAIDGIRFVAATSLAVLTIGGLFTLAGRRPTVRGATLIALVLLTTWAPVRRLVAAAGLTGLHWGPAAALGFTVWGAVQYRRAVASPAARLALLLGAFTLGLMARWGFLVHEYSREYSAPTLILIGGLIVHALATRLVPWLGARLGRPATAGVITWVVTGFIVLYGYAISTQVLALYSLRTYPVRSARGEIYTQPPLGRVFDRALARLGEFPPDTELFVVPEEGFLNFISGLRSRVPYSTLIPGMLIGREAEARFVTALTADAPQLVIITQRHYPEFSLDTFATYNPVVARWVQQHYAVLDRIVDGDYGLAIYVRGRRPPPQPAE